jgi:arylsulfatase A-like enzyme
MFSGQYPSLHGVTTMRADMGPNVPHAAEMFSRAGYRTIAISANAFISRASGFARGFDEFVDPADLRPPGSKSKVRGHAVVEALDRSLREQSKTIGTPLFVYIHLMDPHWPYGPSDEILSRVLPRFGDPSTLRQIIGEIYFGTLRLDRDTSPPVRNAVHALYAAEAAATDDVLRSLFEILDRQGVTPNAVVILTADHGEELFEHDGIGHGKTLYEEVVRVPLMIWFPHQRQRVDVHGPVSLVDLLPTSLRAAAIPFRVDEGTFAGQSLIACAPPHSWTQRLLRWFWRPQCSSPGRVVLAELFPLKSEPEHPPLHRAAIVRGERKLIVGSDRTLLGFEVDRLQDRERPSSLDPSTFQALEAAWREFEVRASAAGVKQREVTPDPATREQLRALGYDS